MSETVDWMFQLPVYLYVFNCVSSDIKELCVNITLLIVFSSFPSLSPPFVPAMTPPRMLHLNPPFRAEHVGSLLRPSKLLRKRRQFENKKCTLEELQAAEDEAIKYVVKLQQDVGMKTITDGEMRR